MSAPENIYIDPLAGVADHRGRHTDYPACDFNYAATDVKYIRHDIHAAVVAENEELRKQIKIVQNAARNLEISGREIAKHDLARAEKLFSESKPEVIDSEREANSLLTEENLRLEQENEQLRARLNAAMEWQSVLDADLPHVLIGVAVALKDGSWCEADHDHGTFRTAVGQRDITQEVIKVMRIKPPAARCE